jgi:hypothetical protein
MISHTLLIAEFSADIERLVRETGRTALDVVLQEGKLLEQDLVKLTPPFGSAPSTESFNAQRKVGENAVERDVKRVFHIVDLDSIRSDRLRDRLRELVRKQDLAGIKAALKDAKIKVNDVVREASADIHEKFRDSRGRVQRPKWIWVASDRSLKRYLKAAKAMVGKAKAGWAAGAQALGVRLPNWITRHGSGGGSVQIDRNPQSPQITIRNAVPYIQTAGGDLKVVETAIRNRMRNIRVKLERLARRR